MGFHTPQSPVIAGVSSLTAHALLLGQGSGNITAMAAATDGQSPYGVTSADPVSLQFGSSGMTANFGIQAATTTNANDSIKMTGSTATLSATNPFFIVMPSTVTAGLSVVLKAIADVTLNITGCHWGAGTKGDLSGALIHLYAINDNGTLKWGAGYVGARNNVADTDTSITGTSITAPEFLLVNTALTAGTWPCAEIGIIAATFDDTGGAAEDLWSVSTSATAVILGRNIGNGAWQDFNTTPGGFDVAPTWTYLRWCQNGKMITAKGKKNANGTSTNLVTTFTLTLPVKAKAIDTGMLSGGVNNGAAVNTASVIQTRASSVTADLFVSLSGGAWSGTSGNRSADFQITYEAA